ncbi:MAG: ATP-binding protein, partial [Anaerolineae bacterium]
WLEENEDFQRQMRTNERRLASIMNASADAILGVDAQGRIESWNLGAELLLGYQEGDVLNQPFSSLFGDRPAVGVELDWLLEYLQKNRFIHGHETTCLRVDGRSITVELTATLLQDDSGNVLGMSVILRDITLRKKRLQEIQRLNTSLNEQVATRTGELAQKVKALAQVNEELQLLDQTRTEFVSLVSHQIRAPLTNMSGAVQRMQTSCNHMNPTCGRMMTIMQQQITRLDRLVQDVLQATRLESGELVLQSEPISVLPVIQQVVEQTRVRSMGRPFHLPTKPGLPLVYADRDCVTEVLINLLDNADKYSPPQEDIVVEVRANETEVTVVVQDAGPGLPPDDLERVFDKFYRTDGSDAQAAYGYGLGLYVCRQLIAAQNGRIWAENHPDGGAVFSFTLPVWDE